MTELTEPDDATAQPGPEWPQPGAQDIPDPQVAQAVARLFEIPGIPVADHEAVYDGLHDELLAALNSDPAESPAGTGPSRTDSTRTGPAGGAA
jgi:hypothetical protein